jgi:hypothetical protein
VMPDDVATDSRDRRLHLGLAGTTTLIADSARKLLAYLSGMHNVVAAGLYQ